MIEILKNLYTLFNSPQFLLLAICFSLLTKAYLLRTLILQGIKINKALRPWMLLIVVLVGSMIGDTAWLIKLFRTLIYQEMPYNILVFIIRTSWGFLIIQYQALAFFMESLTEKKIRLNGWRKILFIVSSAFACFFFYLAIFDHNLTESYERNLALLLPTTQAPLEIKMFRYAILYLLNLITIPSIFLSIQKIRKQKLPKILKKQLKIFMIWFMLPYLIIEFLIAIHHNFISLHPHTYAIVGISTVLLSWAAYYCLSKVIRFRFLNVEPCVQSTHNVNFVYNFKKVLEQLSHATTEAEIERIIQNFFKETFNISPQRVHLCVRPINSDAQHSNHSSEQCKIECVVENIINMHDAASGLYQFVRMHKIVIKDEIEYNNFYEENELGKTILTALDAISSDIFLPIFQQQKIIAYITVEEFSRPEEFFGEAERDQMVVFASYLSNIIHLLQNRNLETLIHQEKELKKELYQKQQELQQYRECIGSFLRQQKQKDIGIIFYKNRRFVFGNQAAKEMVGININTHEGHQLTKTLKDIAHKVLEYKATQSALGYDSHGNKIVISGILNLENNNVIITLYYPEISDLIRKKMHLLKDPAKWDYLLYLETTQSGKLINQLIPGSGEILLNFKIELFKTALNKRALLLAMPEEDLMPTVEILHHISLRDYLHIIKLGPSSNSVDIAIKIFGINPILGIPIQQQPILEKLNTTGTLFIDNIHFLSLEVQEYLAEFIKYGIYRLFRSDQKMSSDVRIICSTDQNLAMLVQEGKFSATLFNELKMTTLQMPSLPHLPENELSDLAEGFTEQAIKTDSFKHILELTDREKDKLIGARPTSLQELKMKIQQILIQKSKKTNIYQETQFDPAFNINTPDLTQAARLGKHALKDPKIMAMLWNKFKNQNQIAAFLGVNRSSVNRRCKDYNLL